MFRFSFKVKNVFLAKKKGLYMGILLENDEIEV